jgi:tetratricopeptide (TPR) repeat protein
MPFGIFPVKNVTFTPKTCDMKSRLLLLVPLSLITALLAFRLKEMNSKAHAVPDTKVTAKKTIMSCGPDWEALKEWFDETDIPPVPGSGIYKWKISTSNDSAQFYFNQGINMYYSFHIIEAMASFKKAARFDPGSAILYWAQALCYGPNINDFGYRASPEALAAVNKAKELSANSSPLEKELINAMSIRYTGDSADVTRAELNQDYADMMKKVYSKFPNNPDAQALYADAMMLQHPWDLWYVNGTPKQWTPLIREVLERLLSKSPNHPGANHYYIHVMEPSPFAAKALPSAERLGKTNPGLSHVVHMPSHIYLRTGNYNKGVDVNIDAVNSYKKSIPLYAPVTGADFLYIIHNLHMKTNNAMLAGNFKISQAAAFETRNSIPFDYLSIPAPMGNAIQYIYMVPTLVYIRFGKWDELLQMPEPEHAQVYANVLYRFGRGMALAGQSRFAEAKYELEQMQQGMKDSSLAIPFSPFSSALEGSIVADGLLTGTIAVKEKRMSDAVFAFGKAVTTEENMIYDEPRDWLLNPKHFLANAFLENGDGEKAEEALRKDLLNNNENGWALFGLYKALLQQKKNAEAAKVLSRFKTAFSKADVKITTPVY